jgi:predicted peptidase
MVPRIAILLPFISAAMVVVMSNAEVALADDAHDRFEARTFTDADGVKLLYRLLKPKDYDSAKQYPLVVFLHGAGERGDDNDKQLVHGMNDFASDKIMEKYPCFVIAPQCPTGSSWASFRRNPEQGAEPAKPLGQTLDLVESLTKEFSIDKKRLYISGLSMGGFGTWDALVRNPDMFAAAAPICGGGDPAKAEKIAKLPIWVFHGDADPAVNVERSREMVEALKEAGGSPKYTEYEGVGHDSWTATYKNPEFYEWLFDQRKSDKQ